MKTEVIKLVTDACETCKGNNQVSINLINQSIDIFQSTAQSIKELLDGLYGGSWHVVVGEQFGVEVTHETGYILYMFFGTDKAICVWRCA